MAANLQDSSRSCSGRAPSSARCSTLPLGVVVSDSGMTVRKANTTFARFVGRDAADACVPRLYEAAAGSSRPE